MDKQLIERAVEAAARGAYEHEIRAKQPDQPEYDLLFDGEKDEWTRQVRAGVIAALAEVEAHIKAEAWDEGEAAGLRRADFEYGAATIQAVRANPYRIELTKGTITAAAARIARVEALHVEHERPCSCVDRPVNGECVLVGLCDACRSEWPCPTIKAIRGESE